MNLLLIFLGAALINNVILSHALGLRGMVDASKQVKSAFGFGLIISSVMLLSGLTFFPIYHLILYPLGNPSFHLVVMVLVIVGCVQLVEGCLKKCLPIFAQEWGTPWPLITANSAILGILLLGVDLFHHPFGLTMVYIVGTATGLTLVMVLFAGIWERIQYNEISSDFKGIPIAMITAGLMAIVFFGFTGLFGM